jgi:uncharacterized protein YgiM (DUF1202 family)
LREYNAEHYTAAFILSQKSAEQGNADGQANLGFLYRSGLGTDKDFAKAFRLAKKSAQAGSVQGQINLGVYYRDGIGVRTNYSKAKACFKKLAKQGNERAKELLTNMKKSGLDKGNFFLSLLFGLLCAGGVSLLFTSIAERYGINNGFLQVLSVIIAFVLFVFFLTAGYSVWRKKHTIRKILFLCLALVGIGLSFFWGSKMFSKLIEQVLSIEMPTQPSAAVTQDVNFRDAPGTDSNVICALKAGESVSITGEVENGWIPIEHNGEAGWVSAEYVKQ